MTPVYARESLGDAPVAGPLVIEEAYTTLLVTAGWSIRQIEAGHLLAEKA